MKIKEKSKKAESFFSKAPKERISYNLTKKLQNTTVHNFSNHYLTTNHFNILSKGLSFAPYHPFTQKDHTTIVHQFDTFSDFLRNIIISVQKHTHANIKRNRHRNCVSIQMNEIFKRATEKISISDHIN